MTTKEKSGTTAAAEKKKGRAAVIIIIVVVVVLAAVFAGAGFAAASYDKIYPNVSVGDTDVGGMSESEARAAIQTALDGAAPSEDMTVLVLGEGHVISAADINSGSTAAQLAHEAYLAGRGDGFLGKMLSRFGLSGKTQIASAAGVSESFLREFLSGILTEKTEPSSQLDGEWLIITKGTDGLSADMDAAVSQLEARYAAGDYSPFTLQASADPAKAPDVQALFDEYCTPAVDAVYDLETGEVSPHQDGFGFDLEQVEKDLADAAPGEKVYVMLKAMPAQVTEDTAWDALFENVLYTYTTNLTNIPNRTNNVTLGAAALNGTVIMPGETFSFNGTVGERTSAKGYRTADVYVGGNTVGELGGGVCQLASTLYVCCLYTDLEIVERTEHQFFVTYVPSGLDATVYWGHKDYKFKNNTEYPIMIEAGVSGLELTIALKGQKANDNYVEMTSVTLGYNPCTVVEEVDETKEPGYRELKNTGYNGYTISTTRNVYDKDGNLLESTHEATSYYNRRDKVYIVGPQEGAAVTDPTEPTEPTEPTQPTQPTDPTQPAEPTAPTEPAQPEQPSQPATPGETPSES